MRDADGPWRPTRGARVRIRPRPHAPDDEPPPPAGVWYVIDRGPQPMTWWVKAVDLEAQAWAAAHPGDITSGCWLASGKHLDPFNRARV